MIESLKFKHFSIEREQRQQINITAPCLFHDTERASILQILLLKRNSIKDVQINLADDSVVIKFDQETLCKDDLLNLLDDVLANFSQKPREKIKRTDTRCPRCGGLEKEVSFFVEGMSCASCALYLQMVLSRNKKVSNVNIDYSTKKGFVSGCLSQDDIFDIVEKHGYSAHSTVES